jgi:hypothetical protein
MIKKKTASDLIRAFSLATTQGASREDALRIFREEMLSDPAYSEALAKECYDVPYGATQKAARTLA